MNNYPTADLKPGEYETRQIEKRICENCINSRKSKYRSKIRCLIWNELCNRNDNCLYFFSEIK